jgi:WXG100 family type VII secretion target
VDVNGDQLHGVTETLERAAATAGTVSDNIEGHRAALRPTVDTVRADGWDGSSRIAFERAYAEWEEGITRLVTSLRGLGENTTYSVNLYSSVDEAGQSRMNQVQGMGAFDGALRG